MSNKAIPPKDMTSTPSMVSHSTMPLPKITQVSSDEHGSYRVPSSDIIS